VRLIRCEVGDHIIYHKNGCWRSYRFYRALQRLKSPTHYIYEIFGAPRFSSFSTQSARSGRSTKREVRKVPTPDIQKWITLDPEASIRRAVPSRFSAISLGAHGVSIAILQRCRTLNGKWSSFKRLSELIDTTAQSGCR
jgi:hypothetical protein